jgi:hypothetical protein
MEAMVFQMFDPEGGVGDSERSEVRQKAQERSHLDNESPLLFETRTAPAKGAEDSDDTTTTKKNLFDMDNDSL